MLGKKPLGRGIETFSILRPHKAVAFIVKEHVFMWHTLCREGSHNLLSFILFDTLIILTLYD